VTAELKGGKSIFLQQVGELGRSMGWRVIDNPILVKSDITETAFKKRVREGFGIDLPELRAGSNFSGAPVSLGPDQQATLISQLASLGSILLLVDDYQPGEEFQAWFTGVFLEELRRSTVSFVVVAAGTPDQVKGLPYDEYIQLRPMSEDRIRSYFQEVALQLNPPLGEDELETYVRAVVERPDRIYGLMHVLQLARPARQTDLSGAL
jgi:hypothetical protein